jgi:hypothetical protein
MIQGAIIGLIVGIVMTVVMARKRKGIQAAVLGPLNAGDATQARAALDKKVPPLTKIPNTKIIEQRDRMAALTLLNDVQALEAEAASHSGHITALGQVNAVALLGIAVRSADPADAAQRLEALATHVETEGGRLLGLVKKQVRAFAVLGRGLTGAPMDADALGPIASLANESGVTQIVLWQAFVRAYEASGQTQNAESYRTRVQAATKAFDAQAG